MSGQNGIEDVALNFIRVYKRYKDKSFQAREDRRNDERNNLNRQNPRMKGRLDKHPC